MLNAAGFSLQGNRKTKVGAGQPDRNAQCEHINATVTSQYPAGTKVTDDELAAINPKRHDLAGEWNYTLLPTRRRT